MPNPSSGANGVGQGRPVDQHQRAAAAGVLAVLEESRQLLREIRDAVETEPEIDNTYVVGGTFAAAAVLPINLPRGTKHVQIELSVGTSTPNVFAAVFAGNVSVGDAGNRHNPAAGGSPSGAICASNGNTVKARDNLDETGIMTVYFTGAATIYANVRVRILDTPHARRGIRRT